MRKRSLVASVVRPGAAALVLPLMLVLAAVGLGERPQQVSAQTASVTIVDFAFQPAAITVPVGTTVTWTNRGQVVHTTTSDTGVWDSGLLNPGGTFSRQFTQAGTFAYHCNVHPSMTATVVVQAATATPTATPTRTATPTVTVTPTLAAATATATPGAAETRTVVAGAQDLPGISVNHFGPAEIRIQQGWTVTWRNPNIEIHTVTFGIPRPAFGISDPAEILRLETEFLTPNPQRSVTYTGGPLNSGQFNNNQTFSVTFPNTGTFTYVCLIHPGMDGRVVVVPSGQAVPAQAQVDAQAQQELQPLLAAARAERERLRAQPVRSEPRPDGTTLYRVQVGAVLPQIDLNLFFPDTLSLREGDTVLWEAPTTTPHTVTFGELPPPTAGPPPVEFFTGLKPSPNYEGGFSHSGWIGQGWAGGQTFSLNFTRAGTYTYICILHADQGQLGRINVAARAVPATPTPAPAVVLPRTGGTGSVGWSDAAIAAAIALGIGLLGGSVVLRARRTR